MVLKWDSQQAMKPIAFDQDDHVRSEDSFLDIAVVSRGGRLNSGWKKVHLFARSFEAYRLSARTHACFQFCIFLSFTAYLVILWTDTSLHKMPAFIQAYVVGFRLNP